GPVHARPRRPLPRRFPHLVVSSCRGLQPVVCSSHGHGDLGRGRDDLDRGRRRPARHAPTAGDRGAGWGTVGRPAGSPGGRGATGEARPHGRRERSTVSHGQAISPYTGEPVGDPVPHTPAAAVDEVCRAAASAAPALAAQPLPERAGMLAAVAAALERARDDIVALADAETGLGTSRLGTELTRTRVQLELFAEVVRDGSFLEAMVDPPDPGALPAPRPDVRRMLVPLGPVAVFAASNFPLAFSVPGGDTASALAAGCPVIVKAHPAHPGLSDLCGRIVAGALREAGAPAGSFAVVHGLDAGRALVTHPAVAAVAFTGSAAAGRALFDLACGRPDPIPFY